MFLYLGLILGMFAIAFGTSFFKKKILNTYLPIVLFVIIMTLFCGLKSLNIGIDTIQYERIFYVIRTSTWEVAFKQNVEYGWILYNKLFGMITDNFYAFDIVFYFIVWACLAVFAIAYVKKDAAIAYVTIVAFFLQFAITAYRQTFAFAFMSLGLGLFMLIKNKWVRWPLLILFFVVAFFMHKTSIVSIGFIAIYLLTKRYNINIYVCLGLYLLSLVGNRAVYFIIATIRDTTYTPFVNNDIPSTSIMAILIFLVGYYVNYSDSLKLSMKKLEEKYGEKNKFTKALFKFSNNVLVNERDNNKYKEFYAPMLVLTLIGACAMSFNLVSTIFARMYVYFEGAVSVSVVGAIENRKNKIIKYFAYGLLTFFLVVYFYISMKRSGYIEWYIPYEMFF